MKVPTEILNSSHPSHAMRLLSVGLNGIAIFKNLGFLVVCIFVCTHASGKEPTREPVAFVSPDTALCRTFEWARTTALGYAHDADDPVGCWYEAALPNRAAFCMRDASHQSIGAEVLDLSRHNANMMAKFAAAVTPERDWCSLWEIDKNDRPAPADYVDDTQFWYNLNGSADVVFACERLYRWTGDACYLTDSTMVNYYEKSLGEFVERWQLAPEQLLYRARNMNTELPFKPHRSFNYARGIPSYAEDVQGFSMALDLVGTLYGGNRAYARMLEIRGDSLRATEFYDRAVAYREHLDQCWWEPQSQSYFSFWDSNRGQFTGGYPNNGMYLAWFGAVTTPEQLKSVLDAQVASTKRAAEHDSYLPALLYRYKYTSEAYDYLLTLPGIRRSDYPEVSFGTVEAITTGVMGIAPCADEGYVQTLAQLSEPIPWAEMSNVPLLGTTVRVRHDSNWRTAFTNQGVGTLRWRAAFYGDFERIAAGGRCLPAMRGKDAAGNIFSYVDVMVAPGKRITARVVQK